MSATGAGLILPMIRSFIMIHLLEGKIPFIEVVTTENYEKIIWIVVRKEINKYGQAAGSRTQADAF